MPQDATREFESRGARKSDIDDRDIGLFLDIDSQSALRIARVEHFYVELAGEHRRAAGDDDWMVVNDQDAHLRLANPSIVRYSMRRGRPALAIARTLSLSRG